MRVAVLGAGGAMGTMVCKAILASPDMELVGGVDPRLAGIDFSQATGVDARGLMVSGSIEYLSAVHPDAVVDFSLAEGAYDNLLWCARSKVRAVVGTTGLSKDQVTALAKAFESTETGAILASNFSIGAVLMMRFAEVAAPFFDSAEIVEMHHERKVDAPSGTAIATANQIARGRRLAHRGAFLGDPTEREVLEGARGGEMEPGVHIHSLRVKGAVAHQEVILGAIGQSLTIRHDTYDRTSFMPGVLLALRAVMGISEFVEGIDWIIDQEIKNSREGGVLT